MVEREDWPVKLENGTQVTVKYKSGFPDFSPFAKAEMELPKKLWFKSDAVQFRRLNKRLYKMAQEDPEIKSRFTKDQLGDLADGDQPKGYTWHHHQEAGRMQLVPTEIHQKSGHTGGREIWGGGNKRR